MNCNGPNCTASAENGHKHSSECLFEYRRNVASGVASATIVHPLEHGVTYMHATKGMCRLIAPDPEDGALLIMERVGDDEVLGQYFGCEKSDLYKMGTRMVDRQVVPVDGLPPPPSPPGAQP